MQTAEPVARPTDDVCVQDAAHDPCPAQTKHQLHQRHNEQVGGGFFVFRRGTRTGRIKTGHIKAGNIPFEHPSLKSALAEAERLAELHGGKFDILSSAHQIDGGLVRRADAN